MLWNTIFENAFIKSSLNIPVKNYIDTVDDPTKSNKELASELNISVSTLTRMFKKHFNSTPAAYNLSRKIYLAKFQLTNTNMLVSEIAQNQGFNSPEHFSRIFKKHTGMSPVKYRNAHTSKNIRASRITNEK